jgi:Domain of unknown function (DUF4190)
MSTPEQPETPSTEQTPPTAYGLPPQPPVYGYPQPYAPVPPTDGAGIAALVLGIVSLTFACAYGFGLILSPVALFLGRSSMKRIDASQGQIGGRGFAQAGFIMGIVGTVLLVLMLVALAVFFTALFSTDCFGDGC